MLFTSEHKWATQQTGFDLRVVSGVWSVVCWCHSSCGRVHMHYTGNDQSRLAATVEWTWPHSSHTLCLLQNHQTDLKDKETEKENIQMIHKVLPAMGRIVERCILKSLCCLTELFHAYIVTYKCYSNVWYLVYYNHLKTHTDMLHFI